MRIDFEKENTSITFIADGNLMYVYTKDCTLIFDTLISNNKLQNKFGNNIVFCMDYSKYIYRLSNNRMNMYLEQDEYFQMIEFLRKWKRYGKREIEI